MRWKPAVWDVFKSTLLWPSALYSMSHSYWHFYCCLTDYESQLGFLSQMLCCSLANSSGLRTMGWASQTWAELNTDNELVLRRVLALKTKTKMPTYIKRSWHQGIRMVNRHTLVLAAFLNFHNTLRPVSCNALFQIRCQEMLITAVQFLVFCGAITINLCRLGKHFQLIHFLLKINKSKSIWCKAYSTKTESSCFIYLRCNKNSVLI